MIRLLLKSKILLVRKLESPQARNTLSKLRLNQAIAKTGVCSRRKADELIRQGRVCVNGKPVSDFSFLVDQSIDELSLDGKSLAIKKFVYIALHKPAGIVSTCADDRSRETVLDLLPTELAHLRPVGRLDMYSEGLLILTNDGTLTQKLTHPLHHASRKYLVRIKGDINKQALEQLRQGIPLEDGLTGPAKVRLRQRNNSYSDVELTIYEGRNRQIRRMFAYLGYTVARLIRLSIGRLQLDDMPPGSWRYLSSKEIEMASSTTQG